MTRQSWLLLTGLLLLSYGGCVVRNSSLVQALAERVPRMTCDQLVRNGPGQNYYVTLTDVRLCSGGYLMRRDGMDGNLDELCQPVYSAALVREPQASELTLLLRITADRAKDELIGQPGVVEFTCRASRNMSQIDAAMAMALEKKYPGIQLAQCWLLNVGHLEPTVARAERMTRDGIVALVIGGALVLTWAAWRWLGRPNQA